jgi:SAM-dependent methyltransferase
MKHTPDDLNQITATTLGNYNQVAESFREGTRDHDVSQNIDALLRHIQGEAPFSLLDFGCGPGRDLQTFTRMGHVAVGLDGSERFAQMAREDSGCEVWQQDFLQLDLPGERFDGIFANGAVSYSVAGIATGVEATARDVETGWCVVQL